MGNVSNLFKKKHKNISALAAHDKLEAGAVMVDVRNADEYLHGHVEGARNFPLAELHRIEQELDKNRELLVICQSGSSSSKAAKQLRKKGFKAINVSGGTTSWHSQGLPMSK